MSRRRSSSKARRDRAGHSSSSKTRKRRTKKNPSAWALYEAFHGDEPKELIHANAASIPRKVWALGDVVAIVYKRPGERVPYEHVFHKPHPLLVSDREGRRLFLVGGGYRVKHVGIVR